MVAFDLKRNVMSKDMKTNFFSPARVLMVLIVSALGVFVCNETRAEALQTTLWRPLAGTTDCSFYDFLYGNDFPVKAHWSGQCEHQKIDGMGTLSITHFDQNNSSIVHSETILKGNFQSGLLQGAGEFIWIHPSANMSKSFRYVGSFKDSRPHGLGKLEVGSALTFEGIFENGNFNGDGKMYIAGRATIRGDFKGSVLGQLFYGYGTIEYADGTRYVGEFQNALEHGKGVKYFIGGARFDGEFQNGWVTGLGTMTMKDGSTCKGAWQNLKLVGEGEGLHKETPVTCVQTSKGIEFKKHP